MDRIEAPRARRIRDRERLAARAARVSSFWNDRPDDAHREVVWGRDADGRPVIVGYGGLVYPDWEWRDLGGTVRRGHRTWDDVFAARAKFGRRYFDHLAHCSGVCCANPRRSGGSDRLTLQERRARDATREAIAGIGDAGHALD